MGEQRQAKIAIIGGSGFENPDLFERQAEHRVCTPFGEPSGAIVEGLIAGQPVYFLSRHGTKHTLGPGQVNYRANIWALRSLGVTTVVATTACGSLRDDYRPGDMVVLDDFIDRSHRLHIETRGSASAKFYANRTGEARRLTIELGTHLDLTSFVAGVNNQGKTWGRKNTFYDGTIGGPRGICHLPMSPVFCEKGRQAIIKAAASDNHGRLHERGTVVVIEGPRFSSRAESVMHKQWGADLVNMTTVPEAVLAKEAGLSYAAVGLVTDYDAWRVTEEPVSMHEVLAAYARRVHDVTKVIVEAVKLLAAEQDLEYVAKIQEVVLSSVLLKE